MREHNLQDAMTAFLKALMTIWNHAPFYGNQTRYTFMIRALANQVIDWGVKFLSGGEENGKEVLKTPEIPQMLAKVQVVCKVCDTLIEKYAVFSERVQNIMEKSNGQLDEEKRDKILEKLVDNFDIDFKQESHRDAVVRFNQLKKEHKTLIGE
jgi:hypothetical protein